MGRWGGKGQRANMSKRTDRIFAYLQAYVAEHGGGPTLREIQVACGIPSVSGVAYSLDTLEEAGKITRRRSGTRRAARGVRLVEAMPEAQPELVMEIDKPWGSNPSYPPIADVVGVVVGDRTGALVFIPDPVEPTSEAMPRFGPASGSGKQCPRCGGQGCTFDLEQHTHKTPTDCYWECFTCNGTGEVPLE